jgi:hypothetical protein
LPHVVRHYHLYCSARLGVFLHTLWWVQCPLAAHCQLISVFKFILQMFIYSLLSLFMFIFVHFITFSDSTAVHETSTNIFGSSLLNFDAA